MVLKKELWKVEFWGLRGGDFVIFDNFEDANFFKTKLLNSIKIKKIV